MSKNFWQILKNKKKPILALAPMAGFTDSAFRQICKKYGADVLYSEMASATALFYNQKIKNNATLELLKFNRQKEKYYVVQLFGSNPEHFAVATKIISKYIKPDGIDINFGCPVPKIIKQGAGSGLMKSLDLSKQVIKAVLENTDLPVSIKIRAKSGEIDALKFLKNISDLPIAALMIHGRTLSQGFAGEPDYKLIKESKKYFNGVVLVNGGINNLEDVHRALEESSADGLGLARGVLGRPCLFKEVKSGKNIELNQKKIFKLMLEHASLEKKLKGNSGIIELRKHLPWYLSNKPGASKLRERIVKIKTIVDLKKIFNDVLPE